ncbi:MAG: V-type ATP synthase subunit A [Candidatus Heimdallarchaeota archaeon]
MPGVIKRIAGPVVFVYGLENPKKNHVVEVGEERLLGEIIQLRGDTSVIQVYEETSGMGINEPVIALGRPLTVRLGPGVMSTVYDGIQRPLDLLQGSFIGRGEKTSPLDVTKKWHFIPESSIKPGTQLMGGEILGRIQETDSVEHRVLVPPDYHGTVSEIVSEGKYVVTDTVAHLEDKKGLVFYHDWPVRRPRPFKARILSDRPFLTGQRILDFLFPLVDGGSAMIPGGFGTGKTVLNRTLAKFASTDIMQMTLCGERGNEAADALKSFLKLVDPRTDRLMIERTSIIANTSNMPVAAREASIYMGITLAEFYRDQGYSVSVLADSTSRWAEALREISGRLGEIPGEEGFPSYLPKLIGQFYERSGRVTTLSDLDGSITTIGAVSPQGGDFSEPVTQYTMRFTTSLWALDTDLARSRHFPAISWRISYSQNIREIAEYAEKNVSSLWNKYRAEISTILQEEEELERIVRLVGKDTLSESQKGLLLTAELIREGFLQQNAFSDEDAFSPVEKTLEMARAILDAHHLIQGRVEADGLLVDPLYEEQLIEDIKRLRELSIEEIKGFSQNLPSKVEALGI